jgi:hypothetical protein
MAQTGLKLLGSNDLLPQPPEYWDYKCALLCRAKLLGVGLRPFT